jgi:hypothetical protein
MVAAILPTKRTTHTPGVTIPGVEIFATGHYRGKDWSVRDLEEMAENFNKLGPDGNKLLQPPIVLGHEETQEFLEKTNLPSAGWPSKVWLKKYNDSATGKPEAILLANFADVPQSIANLIKNRRYRKVSAEIYDDFTDDHGNGYGKAIRRIALLGGEIPQVKRIADIPIDSFSDRPIAYGTRLRRGESNASKSRGTYYVFSEVIPMDRASLSAQALAAGLDQAVIDTMTDDQLAAVVKVLPAAAAPADPLMMADMPREDLIAELVAAGQDPATLEPLSDDELQELYNQLNGGETTTMADMTREEMIAELVAQGQDPVALEAKTDDELAAMLKPAEAAAAPAVAAMSERNRQRRTLTSTRRLNVALAREEARLKVRLREVKKRDAESFCESLVTAGRIRPVDKANYLALLMTLNDVRHVHKFTEGGKVKAVTAYEAKKKELSKLPVVIHFGEKLQSKTTTTEGEVQKVKSFAEMNQGAIKASGKTKEQFVHSFTELRKKKPELTAVEFGIPADFVG